MKTPITPTKHDLYECYGKRVVSTIATNLPYRICRHKKMVMETLPNYPKGTFFVITENGKRPNINKGKEYYQIKLNPHIALHKVEESIIDKLKSIKPDYDKAESYQHGFHDAVEVMIKWFEQNVK